MIVDSAFCQAKPAGGWPVTRRRIKHRARRISAVDQSMTDGIADQVGRCLEIHFPHEAEFVRADGLDAQEQVACDLAYRPAGSEHEEYLEFPFRQCFMRGAVPCA